ncbi:hypothetical protein [Phenylobacterium sp. 58.2.17]|uniref:hypothetical protein n=1 Tax=Phenylobacterium sp. 58.2.17 TaxID=2969306 RepID=UPI002264A97C|nr:hypothetical protein [Phenylobacterium sp. 58.2.17]MCX7584997.1 hypothetical protein [Phenylobacterium sp. 58.2.17]
MFDALTYRLAAVVGTVVVLAMIAMTVFAALGEKAAKAQNKELRADLVTTNQAWGECKATLAQANGEIEQQTAQVQAWKAKADAVQREADAAVAKARQEAAQYRKRADRLARIPTPTAGQCEAAAALYVQVISEDVK